MGRGSKEGSRSSSITYPLPPPPQHISTYTQKLQTPSPGHVNEMIFSPHLKSFTLNELMYATRHFCDDYLLGEGGFGYVYKGWLNKETLTPVESGSGMAVAVKKLKPEGFQGQKEWLSEITYLGQLDHPNLVNLLGFCSDGENRLLVILVATHNQIFVCPQNWLFPILGGAQPLSWALRLKVVVEAARGLSFLHASEPKIIYRDFKCSNILLDMDYNAKLSDFGLAKAGPTGDLTHVTTQVMGTQGYTAPEYIATGRLTTKCDVFSFGIVLLELITGRRAIDKNRIVEERKLLEWVRPQLSDTKRLFRIMDSKLEGKYSRRGAYIVANLALQCCHPIAKYRPLMCEVVSILEKIPSSSRADSLNKMSSSKSQTNTNGSSPILQWPSQGSPLMPQK
ncbi:Concanavalin A-like lectin/glucanase, subgroup [Artemisia annua]|uniref:non-specific serine/threonine protein kinase n=1 Tax=Artemisia annua TaxID=35608 RepID=A0A2U1KYR3_ARTAN|nr:Concanavalin A-like lectin/glucanase, subgroup [Artemisia annua]